MKKYILIFSSLLTIGILTHSCTKDENETIDEDLKAQATAGNLTAYKNTPHDTITMSDSPHDRFTIWFNEKAVTALDPTSGELPSGDAFPEGSLIVKTRFAIKGGPAIGYLVMKKDPGNTLSQSGYVWGEYLIDGTIVHSAREKGSTCIGCHAGGTNRDFIRVFDIL